MKKAQFLQNPGKLQEKPCSHSLNDSQVRLIVEEACTEYKNFPHQAFTVICKALGGKYNLNKFFRCRGYDKEYFTLFTYLEWFDRPGYRILKEFIQQGLNINLQDGEGNTPLLFHIACGNHDEALQLMTVLHKNRFSCAPNFDLRAYTAEKSSDGMDL